MGVVRSVHPRSERKMSMETTERKRGKRPNGDGSYRERKDGTWECRITLDNGQRKSIYGKTLAECRAKRQQAERDMERGLDITAKPQTVSAFLTDWLENTAKPTLRPKTHHSYAWLVRLYIEPAIGHLKLAKLAPP